MRRFDFIKAASGGGGSGSQTYTPARLYLPSAGTAPMTPPAVDSSWSGSIGLRVLPAVLSRTNSSQISFSSDFTGKVTGGTYCLAQFVSPPMTAQTLSGAWRAVWSAQVGSNTGSEFWAYCKLRIVSADGSTQRGDDHGVGGGYLLPSPGSSYTYPGTNGGGGSLPSVTVQDGDYLVFELGYQYFVETGEDPHVTTFLSDNSATDLAYSFGNTDTADNPWIEFTNGITFKTGPVTPPTITNWSPSAGSTQTTVPSAIVATFSQAMNTGTTGGGINNSANWSITTSIGTASIASVTPISSTSCQVNLSTSGITSGAILTITASTSIADSSGNHLSGTRSAAYQYQPSQTTSIVAWSPTPGGTLSTVPTQVTVTFSGPMDATSTTLATNWTATTTSGSWVISTTTPIQMTSPTVAVITFTTSGVASGATLSLSAGAAVHDQNGNSLIGTTSSSWTYSTGTGTAPPTAATTQNYVAMGLGGGGAYGSVSFSPYNSLAFVATDMGTVYRSTDGASTWWPVDHQQVTNSADLAALCSFGFCPDGNVVYFAPGGLKPVRSTDGGITWSPMSIALQTSGATERIRYFVTDSVTATTVYAATMIVNGSGTFYSGGNGVVTGGSLWKSTDKGVTWTKLSSVTGCGMGTFIDYNGTSRVIYHATPSAILQSTDGTTFTTWYTPSPVMQTPNGAVNRASITFAGGRDTNGLTLAYIDNDSTACNNWTIPTNDTTTPKNCGNLWVMTVPGANFAPSPSFTKVTTIPESYVASGTHTTTTGVGNFVRMAENDSQTIYVAAGNWGDNKGGQIWCSRNAGTSWQMVMWPDDWDVSPFTPWPADKLEYSSPGLDSGWFDGAYWSFNINNRNSAQLGTTGNFFFNVTNDYGAHWLSPFTKFVDGSGSTTTTQAFNEPAANATIQILVGDTTWTKAGNTIYIAGAGYFQVVSIQSSIQFTLKYLAFSDLSYGKPPAATGVAIPVGSVVIPARLKRSHYVSKALEDTSVVRMKFHPVNTKLAYCGMSDQGGMVTEDGGKTFRCCNSQYNCNYDYAFDPGNDQIVYAAVGATHDWPDSAPWPITSGGAGGVYKSTDRGTTWTVLTSTGTNGSDAASITSSTTVGGQMLSIAFDKSRWTIYAGSQGLGVAKGVSTDGGATWTWSWFNAGLPAATYNFLLVPQIEIDPVSGDIYCLITGNDGVGYSIPQNKSVTGIYYLPAGGTTWTLLRAAGQPTLTGNTTSQLWVYPTSFAIDWTDSTRQTMWLTDAEGFQGGAFLATGIWKSTNRGTTWTRMLQFTHARHVLLDPANGNNVFAHGAWQTDGGWGQGGAYYSTDGGTTWSVNRRFPLKSIGRCTCLDPNDSTRYFLTFFGGGVMYGPLPTKTSVAMTSPAQGVIGSIPTTMTVTFSELMGASAGVYTNWSAVSTTGTVSVTGASLSGDTVTLTLSNSGVYSGSTITVSFTGLADTNGRAVSGSTSLTFQYYNAAVGSITNLPFVPLARTSTWSQLLPVSPTLVSNSTSLVTSLINYNFGHFNKVDLALGNIGPMYYLSGSDPQVKIHQTGGWGDLEGDTVPMPSSAQAAGGVDGHSTILNLATGAEYDYYQFNPTNATITTGVTINCTAGGYCNFLTGTGWDQGIGPGGSPGSLTTGAGGIVTSSGNSLMSGVVTIDEFQSGRINHKISMAVGANWGANGVWPATAAAKYTPSGQTATGVGIGPGSLIWSDLTDAQVDALGWDTVSTLLLKAMHNYGGFITDQNSYVPFDVRQLNVVQAGNSSGQTTASNWWSAHIANGSAGSNGGTPFILTQTAAWYIAHWHVVDPTWFQSFSNNQR